MFFIVESWRVTLDEWDVWKVHTWSLQTHGVTIDLRTVLVATSWNFEFSLDFSFALFSSVVKECIQLVQYIIPEEGGDGRFAKKNVSILCLSHYLLISVSPGHIVVV